MCGRYGQIRRSLENYLEAHALPFRESLKDFSDQKHIRPGSPTYVLAYDRDGRIIPAIGSFLYKPHYNPSLPGWINARAEGKAGRGKVNPDDDPDYSGPYFIATNSGSSFAIRNNRCIIPVNYFLEGPRKERLSEPYLIRRRDRALFSLAGFYSVVEGAYHIGIVTTPAASLLRYQVGHRRSPFVLTEQEASVWLDYEVKPEEINRMIHPFDSKDFEAVKLASSLKKGMINQELDLILEQVA